MLQFLGLKDPFSPRQLKKRTVYVAPGPDGMSVKARERFFFHLVEKALLERIDF